MNVQLAMVDWTKSLEHETRSYIVCECSKIYPSCDIVAYLLCFEQNKD